MGKSVLALVWISADINQSVQINDIRFRTVEALDCQYDYNKCPDQANNYFAASFLPCWSDMQRKSFPVMQLKYKHIVL